MKGLDYSSDRPDLAAVVAAGYGFVTRYATTTQKGLRKDELKDLHAHGLGIVLVYEWYAGRAKEGRVAGMTDGASALAIAHDLGFPDSRPIYFAVDYNAPVTDQAAIDAYLRGVAETIGAERVGVYGSYGVMERCHASRSASWFWQTYAWSAGKVSAHAHLLQYLNGQTIGSASVDLNESKQADFGAWFPAAKYSVGMQSCIDKDIIDPSGDLKRMVDIETLAWAIHKTLIWLDKTYGGSK
jgi:hypothetical protein